MRADAPASQPLSRQTSAAYHARWQEWLPLAILSLNGDRTPARIDGFRQRHSDRITMLHHGLRISMKIIARHQLDDPRISEPELQRRIHAYRVSREKMNPWKNKPQGRGGR